MKNTADTRIGLINRATTGGRHPRPRPRGGSPDSRVDELAEFTEAEYRFLFRSLRKPEDKYYGCRVCYGLTYTSCQDSHKFDRAFVMLAKNIPGATPDMVKRALSRR